MIVVKPISPKKLNDAAMQAVFEKAVNEAANDILLDFELTTATWDHKVSFKKEVQIGPNELAVLVGTDDEIYGYVNYGTKPHDIIAKGKALAFPSGYTAKTQPGRMTSGSGGSFGETIFSPYVRHPGTAARNFDKTIQKEWVSKFKTRMEQAMRDAAKASDHEIT